MVVGRRLIAIRAVFVEWLQLLPNRLVQVATVADGALIA